MNYDFTARDEISPFSHRARTKFEFIFAQGGYQFEFTWKLTTALTCRAYSVGKVTRKTSTMNDSSLR